MALRRDLQGLMAALLLAVIGIYAIALRPAMVDGESMAPTVASGHRLLLNRLAYREGWPARGDLVVFSEPNMHMREYIKRVVGLPGEVFEMRDGQVYIDGLPLREDYVLHRGSDTVPPTEIPRHHLFVLGDNRPNSNDSRNFGPLTMRLVHGKVLLRLWPPEWFP